MNMRDYPTLPLDTNESKGSAFIANMHFRVTVRSSSMINSYP